ncbi:MAG: acyltransferase [Rhodopila sp.]|nr:acyltransferase [Rhodopila sp.]
MTREAPHAIGQRESIYLDFVRSLAAFFVVLDHAPTLFDLPNTPRWGHEAVIVFFVLSGYVICNVADLRETTPRAFLIARFARLWSVLFPAMVLTCLCDVVGRNLGYNSWAYVDVPSNAFVIRVGAVLAFLSETWVSIQPLSNQVVWSLCAEFWYYMLFAAWMFVPAGPVRGIAVVIAALLAGHKALLLLPIWLMGVVLQRSGRLRRLSFISSVALWCGGLAITALILATHAYDPAIDVMRWLVSPWLFTHLAQARVFWLDWALGLTVAAHLLGARGLVARLPLERIAAPIRWCAGVSFAAYLFHMPLLHLFAAFLPKTAGLPAIGLTLIAIAMLGPPVERSKRWWRWALSRVADRLPDIRLGRLEIS